MDITGSTRSSFSAWRWRRCIFVDYNCEEIKVEAWRKGEKVTKKMVIEAGLSGKMFKPKTSRHTIPNRPTGLRISLELLKGAAQDART